MSVRRSITWAFAGQGASFVALFGGSIIIARLLSPQELGISAIAMATLAIIQMFAALGVGAYVVREPDLKPETLDAAFTATASLAIALTIAILGVSFVAGPLLGEPAAGRVMRLLAIGPLIGIFDFRPSVMLQRDMRFREIAIISSLCVFGGTATTIACAWYGFSYMSPAIGGLTMGVIGVVGNNIVGRRYIGFGISFAGWRSMAVFGARMLSISGVATGAARTSELILGRSLGMPALGLYTRAGNLANMMFENLYGTATRVVFVQLAKDWRERGDLRTTFLRGFSMITAVMWPLQLGLAVLAGPTIYTLYGDRWVAAAVPLACLMVAQFITLSFGMNWELFVLRDETARQTRLEVSRSIFGVGAVAVGAQFSLLAAALGRVADSLLGFFLYIPHVTRLSGATAREIARIYGQSGALTVAAVTPSLVLMISANWSARVPIGQVAVAVGVGIILWAGLIVALRHPLLEEFRIVARKLPILRQSFAS